MTTITCPVSIFLDKTLADADLVFSIGWIEQFGLEGLVDVIGCVRKTAPPKEDLIFGLALSKKYGEKKAKEMIRGLG